MKFMSILLFTSFAFVSFVEAGNISNVFSGAVFGVNWSDDLEEVQKKYPDGDFSSGNSSDIYAVKDDRDLFGITFNEKNTISYVFHQGILTHIDVSFSEKGNYMLSRLKDSLVAAFGNPDVTQPVSGVVMMKWPEDNGIVLSVISSSNIMGSSLDLNIQNTQYSSKNVSKKSLGFD